MANRVSTVTKLRSRNNCPPGDIFGSYHFFPGIDLDHSAIPPGRYPSWGLEWICAGFTRLLTRTKGAEPARKEKDGDSPKSPTNFTKMKIVEGREKANEKRETSTTRPRSEMYYPQPHPTASYPTLRYAHLGGPVL